MTICTEKILFLPHQKLLQMETSICECSILYMHSQQEIDSPIALTPSHALCIGDAALAIRMSIPIYGGENTGRPDLTL